MMNIKLIAEVSRREGVWLFTACESNKATLLSSESDKATLLLTERWQPNERRMGRKIQ